MGRDGLFDDVVKTVFAELVVDERQRELGAVHGRRRIELFHEIRHAADMVFMPVREENAADLVFILDEIGDIGEDEVDARHLFGREDDARVDDDDVVPVLDGGHVLADLADAAKEEYFDGSLLSAALSLLFLRRLLFCILFGSWHSLRLFAAFFGLLHSFLLFYGLFPLFFVFGELGPLSLCAGAAFGLEPRLLHRLFAEEFRILLFFALCGGFRILFCLFAVIRLDAVQDGKLDGAPPFLFLVFLQKWLLCPRARQRREKRAFLSLLCARTDVFILFSIFSRSA